MARLKYWVCRIFMESCHCPIGRERGAHLSEWAYDSKLKVRTKSAWFPSKERTSLPGIRSVAWALTVHREHHKTYGCSKLNSAHRAPWGVYEGAFPPVTTSGHLCHLTASAGEDTLYRGIVGHTISFSAYGSSIVVMRETIMCVY